MENVARFWHLSDLHLTSCLDDGRCGCGEDACSARIKAESLKRLADELERTHTPPNMLFLTGDITELDCEEAAARFLEPILRAATKRETEVYGILGTDGHDGSTRANSKAPGWGWLLKTGDVRMSRSGVAVVGVSEPTVSDCRRAAAILMPPACPSVLLVHDGDIDSERPFNYRALGHIHTADVVRHDDHHVSGRPGHLYSYWDGPGKAWPVFMIAGTISVANGRVRAWRCALEAEPFNVPATRQIYGDIGGYDARAGNLYLVHAPAEPRFYRQVQPEPTYVEFLQRTGAIKATYRFTSKSSRDDIIHGILEACPDDVFVSPATGKGNADRVATWGRRLLDGPRFEEFVEKTFKRSENTQTSDQ